MTRAQRRRIRGLIEDGQRVRCKTFVEFFDVAMALRGLAVHVLTLHDDTCTPSLCVCTPHFIFERLTPETYVAGQREQSAWVQRSTS